MSDIKLKIVEEEPDCILLVGATNETKEFACHKKVLASCSAVFQAMFFGAMPEKNSTIPITDVEPQEFNKVYEFAYNGCVNIESMEEAMQLIYVTKKYLLNNLKMQCFKVICEGLDVANVCNIYEIAVQFEEAVLARHCLEFIRVDAEKVLRSPEFLDIQEPTLRTILAQCNLNVSSELIVINACIRWAAQEAHRRGFPVNTTGLRAALGPAAFGLIRFLSLTPLQFITGPGESNLLTSEEGYAILRNIIVKGRTVKLPPGVSSERQSRKYDLGQPLFIRNIFEPFVKNCFLSEKPFPQDFIIDFHPVYSIEECEVSILQFTVDQDILLLGFKVSAQTRVNREGTPALVNSYREQALACIYVDEIDTKTASADGLVLYDSVLSLLFKEPVKISKNIEQETVFHFMVQGNYNIIDYNNRLKKNCVDGVNFILNQNQSDGMIYSIIFTKIE